MPTPLIPWLPVGSVLGCCCVCQAPVLQGEDVGATKTKCGFPEFAGYVSTPPKIYLRSDYSHVGSGSVYTGPLGDDTMSVNYASATVYDPGTCAATTTGSGSSANCINPDGHGGCTGSNCSAADESCWSDGFCGTQACGSGTGNPAGACTPTVVTTSTSQTTTNDWTCPNLAVGPISSFPGSFANSVTTTLSDEFTTAALIAAVQADVSALPGTFLEASVVASYDLSASELTFSTSIGQYRFRYPVPPSGCYKITWVERFTDALGNVTDTPKSFSVTGATAPGGYDPADSSTWPVTPVYALAAPTVDGAVEVADVLASCTC